MDQKLNLATLGTTLWVCFSILESPYLYFCVLMLLHMMLVVDESSIGQSKAKCVCGKEYYGRRTCIKPKVVGIGSQSFDWKICDAPNLNPTPEVGVERGCHTS